MRTASKCAVLLTIALAAPVASSATVQAAPKQVITIRAPKSVIYPASIVIRGSITNAKPGQKVGLREYPFDRSFMTTRLDTQLHYKFVLKRRFPHAYTWRAVSGGVYSRNVTVVVQAWRYLADLTPAATSGAVSCNVPVTMGASAYAKSCALTAAAGTPTHAQWRLSAQCTRLRGTFGVTDTSATGAQATLTVSTDKVIFEHTYALGESTATTANIALARQTLKFDALLLQPPAGDVVVGLGNAQILCRG